MFYTFTVKYIDTNNSVQNYTDIAFLERCSAKSFLQLCIALIEDKKEILESAYRTSNDIEIQQYIDDLRTKNNSKRTQKYIEKLMKRIAK